MVNQRLLSTHSSFVAAYFTKKTLILLHKLQCAAKDQACTTFGESLMSKFANRKKDEKNFCAKPIESCSSE